MKSQDNKKEIFLKTLKKAKLMLPPLSGYTDLPFRKIMARFDPPAITTEMVKARAVFENSRKTMDRLKKENGDHLKGVQLLGCDPQIMANAAKILENMDFDYIDINMGCTVKKVASKGEGIALMKNEDLACEIAERVSSSVHIPVTVKIRTGFSLESINVISLAKKLSSSGIQAMTIHGRTGDKKFSPLVDTNLIKQAVTSVPIPVIANGGIFSGRDAKEMLKKTGASAVMPGRGILGNPWIINDISSHLLDKPYHPPALKEKKETCAAHFSYLIEEYGERSGVLKMRRILPWYFTNCQNLKSLRRDVQEIEKASDVKDLLDRINEINGVWEYR